MRSVLWRARKLLALSSALGMALAGVVALAPASEAAVTPIAYDDSYAAALGDTVNVPAPGVLGNDFGVGSGYQAKYTGGSLGSGTVDFHSDGSFTFDPNGNGPGEFDIFYCIVPTSGGDCVSGTAIVHLFNGEPYVPNHSYMTIQGQTLDESAPGLLAGAQNRTAGDYLYIVGAPANGTLDASQDGAFTYTPNPGFIGTDTFYYCISNDADVPGCEGYDSMTGTISVYPAAQPQGISLDENTTYHGSLYPTPGGGVTFSGLVTSAPGHGSVDVNNDGSFSYTPAADYVGLDSFSFCITQDDSTCLAGQPSAVVSIQVNSVDKATTTTVTAPPTITWGTPLVLSAKVTPTDGTGTVAFYAGAEVVAGCANIPVNGAGTAGCTAATTYPAGTYPITAQFSGSGLYLPSTSAAVPTAVVAAPTAIVYDGPSTAEIGAQFTASARLTLVSPEGALAGRTVDFSIAGGDTCSGTTDANGAASCQLTAHALGSASLTVSYVGDANTLPTSTPASIEVSKQSTTVSLSTDPGLTAWSEPVGLTATVSPSATGVVSFTANGDPIGGCANVPLANAVAVCHTTGLPVGADLIEATYGGDATHQGSSGTATVSITIRTTTLTYTGSTSVTVGGPATAAARLTDTDSGDPISGETITFTSAAGSCAATTDTVGAASCSLTFTATAQAGPITATFAGDQHYAGSTAPAQIAVAPAASTTTVAPASSVFTTDATITATVVPTDGGSVAFTFNDAPIAGCGAVPVGGDGTATCVTDALPVGDDTVSADFSGTDNYLASTGSATVTVAPAPTALSYTGNTTGTVVQPMTLSAVLTNVAGDTPSPLAGQSLVFTLADLSCQATTDASGAASCEVTPTTVAQSGPVTVDFAATTDYLWSQISQDATVEPSPTTTTLDAPAEATFSVPVTLTATVTPTDGAGTVAFSFGGATIDGCDAVALTAADSGWQATCTTDVLPVGDDTVTAAYSGTPDYIGSSADAAVTVLIAPTTLTYGGDTTGTVGTPMTVQATLLVDTKTAAATIEADAQTDRPTLFAALRTDAAPVMLLAADATPPASDDPPAIPVVGMPVTFTLGDLTCQALTNANGVASCQITPTAVAQSGQLTADFAGTAQYAAADVQTSITVSQATPTITVDGPSDTVPEGKPVTITATVGPTDGKGTVTFRSGDLTLCADVPLTQANGAWTASCTTDRLPVGDNPITATYSGDDNYLTEVGAFDITVVAAPQAPQDSGQGSAEDLPDTGFDIWTPVGAGLLLIIAGLCAVRMGTRRLKRP